MKMPWLARACFFLLIANKANHAISEKYPDTFRTINQAIQMCWMWLEQRDVRPEKLAAYLDSDATDNPWMQESIFKDDQIGLNALIYMTMVIGHVAHLAYFHSGVASMMSEVIAEAGDNAIEPILEYGEQFGLVALASALFGTEKPH